MRIQIPRIRNQFTRAIRQNRSNRIWHWHLIVENCEYLAANKLLAVSLEPFRIARAPWISENRFHPFVWFILNEVTSYYWLRTTVVVRDAQRFVRWLIASICYCPFCDAALNFQHSERFRIRIKVRRFIEMYLVTRFSLHLDDLQVMHI